MEYSFIALRLGKLNIEQSIHPAGLAILPGMPHKILSVENLIFYLKSSHNNLTILTLLLSVTGAIVAIARKDKRCTLFLVWIISVYIVFTFIWGKESRFTIYWVPAFCALAATCIGTIPFRNKFITLSILMVFISAILFNLHSAQWDDPFKATGFREAAEYVVTHPKGYTIFYNGWRNGVFIFWIRKFDNNRKCIILRGDKLLISHAIIYEWKFKQHIYNADQIYDLFQKYGTTYVVIEKENQTQIPIFSSLYEMLESDKFRLVKEIPIEYGHAMGMLKGPKILIYERLEPPHFSDATVLTLPLPTVDRVIKVPIEKLR